MASIRLAPLLLVLAFLNSLSPTLPAPTRVKPTFNSEGLKDFVYKQLIPEAIKSIQKNTGGSSAEPKAPPPAMTPKASPPAMSPRAAPLIKSSQLTTSPPNKSPTASPPNMSPTASPPSDDTEDEQIGFDIIFSIGNESKTWINARMSISSEITYLVNYQPSYSSSYQCCTTNLTCSKANCNGDYYLEADTFNFDVGYLTNVPYLYKPGDKTQNTTGFLSFSRSPYSLVSIAQQEEFSFFFSDFLECNVTIGSINYTSPLQSTKITTNSDYPYYYFVNLNQISIGSSKFPIGSKTNSSIVILDTVTVPTLLETEVYAHVKSELNRQLGSSFIDKDTGLELCYSTKPNWPVLTLFFPSDPSSSNGAQMVLTSYSYVVNVTSGAECAAIYESEGASVIGILAQLSREMIFDLSNSGPKVSFSQYPAGSQPSEAAVPTKATLRGVLIWSLCVLLYLHIPV